MTIEEPDFKLISDSEYDRYTLHLIKVINAKIPEKRREEFVIAGYDMYLATALEKIIHYRVSKRKEITSLKEFLILYKEEAAKINNLLKK